MTPALEPRSERRLERIASSLPAGARLESRPGGAAGAGAALVFHPAGTPSARVAFFTSCVMEVMFPRLNQDAVRLMVLAGCEVTVPEAQTCCGALHAHAGLRALAKDLARKNARAFDGAFDFIVTDSAGCGAALREAGHLLARRCRGPRGGSILGPCPRRLRSSGRARAARAAPVARLRARRFAAAPHRLTTIPVTSRTRRRCAPSRARCSGSCPASSWSISPTRTGAAAAPGVYNLAHPEMAAAQLEAKLDGDRADGAGAGGGLESGLPPPHGARRERARLGARMVHLVEVLARAYPPSSPSGRT